MPVKEKDKKGSGQIERAGGMIREIRTELRKVVWPTRDEAIRLTAVVIGVSAVVGFFLGGLDTLFTTMFQVILR